MGRKQGGSAQVCQLISAPTGSDLLWAQALHAAALLRLDVRAPASVSGMRRYGIAQYQLFLDYT